VLNVGTPIARVEPIIFILYARGRTTMFIRERNERPRGCERTA
jgi:hypothetical protein